MGGHVTRMNIGVLSKFEKANLQKMDPQERPRRRCEDNIRIDPNEIGVNTKNWPDSLKIRIIG